MKENEIRTLELSQTYFDLGGGFAAEIDPDVFETELETVTVEEALAFGSRIVLMTPEQLFARSFVLAKAAAFADSDSALGCRTLGELCEHLGRAEEACAAYAKGAADGDGVCLYHLGHMTLNGTGCKRDFTKARQLLENAADKGSDEAHALLVYVYDVVMKNKKTAQYHWNMLNASDPLSGKPFEILIKQYLSDSDIRDKNGFLNEAQKKLDSLSATAPWYGEPVTVRMHLSEDLSYVSSPVPFYAAPALLSALEKVCTSFFVAGEDALRLLDEDGTFIRLNPRAPVQYRAAYAGAFPASYDSEARTLRISHTPGRDLGFDASCGAEVSLTRDGIVLRAVPEAEHPEGVRSGQPDLSLREALELLIGEDEPARQGIADAYDLMDIKVPENHPCCLYRTGLNVLKGLSARAPEAASKLAYRYFKEAAENGCRLACRFAAEHLEADAPEETEQIERYKWLETLSCEVIPFL